MKSRIAAVVLAIALSGGVAFAQAQTPAPQVEEIELQVVEAGQRSFTVDPYHLIDCELTRREISLPESSDADAPLVAVVDAQCFYRNEEGQMTPLDQFTSIDQGDTASSQVGEHMVSTPQFEQEPLDG